MTMKQSFGARRLRWFAIALVLALGACGCGRTTDPSDPADGRRALQAALDSWKGGETPEVLARRDPPIRVSDDDWMSGLRLQNYRAEEEGRLVGSDVNFKVVLELKTGKGKRVTKHAVYAVTTRPQLMVLRQDGL